MPSRWLLVLFAPMALVTGCTAKEAPGAAARHDSAFALRLDSLGQAASALSESLSVARSSATPPAPRPQLPRAAPPLSPLADSIARQIAFVARDVRWYTAAARGKRLLVDLGRVDAKVTTPERVAAVREVAARYAPLRVGDHLRLAGPWGTSDATVNGFSVRGTRVVATLDLPRAVDSLARHVEPLVAAATRIDTTRADSSRADSSHADSAAAPADSARARADSAAVRLDSASGSTTSGGSTSGGSTSGGAHPDSAAAGAGAGVCRRDSAAVVFRDTLFVARMTAVRDSIDLALRADSMKIMRRLRPAVKTQASMVTGCFGASRALLVVALRAGRDEYTRERAVLLDSAGKVTPLAVGDYRFRAHEVLHTLDADGDGVDDVAARGFGRLVGSVVVLRLDPKARRLERLTGGFAWEDR